MSEMGAVWRTTVKRGGVGGGGVRSAAGESVSFGHIKFRPTFRKTLKPVETQQKTKKSLRRLK